MFRRWFKMGEKKSPHWSPFLLFFLVNLLEEAHAFLKPWSSDIHTLHLLPYYFSILIVQELYHSSSAKYMSFLSPTLPEFYASSPLALLPFSQTFLFGVWVTFLLCLLFLHVFTLFLIDPLAHTRAFSNHINTSNSNTCLSQDSIVKLSTRHLYFMSLGYVKFNTAISELVLP